MLCEKCQKKPATVRIYRGGGNPGKALSASAAQHLCEDCAREDIQSDPQLKQAEWSKPTKHFVVNINPKTKLAGGSGKHQDS